jgi:ribose 5-phosphate isomerase A
MRSKQLAGEKAIEFIKNGMTIGLGTGSTIYYTILKLGDLYKHHKMNLKMVSTSNSTTEVAKAAGLPLLSINDVDHIDITIDGADEVDYDFQGIKGAGAALLFEKITANISNKNIWVVDDSKIVQKLGKSPLPVEIVTYGYHHIINHLKDLGFNPRLRLKDGEPRITDGNHFIVDLFLDAISDPQKLENELNMIPGVIENGLFINTLDTLIFASDQNVKVLDKTNKNKLLNYKP